MYLRFFNAFVALGLPWALQGSTGHDVFPPARGTWFSALVGFVCIAFAVIAVIACRLRLTRGLGLALMLLYLFYLVTIIHDGATRVARPPERLRFL